MYNIIRQCETDGNEIDLPFPTTTRSRSIATASLNYVYGAADFMIIVTIYLNKRSTLSRNITNGLMLSYWILIVFILDGCFNH